MEADNLFEEDMVEKSSGKPLVARNLHKECGERVILDGIARATPYVVQHAQLPLQ